LESTKTSTKNRGLVVSYPAIATVSRATRAAEGIFAPGHLGELTQLVPFELVDDLLDQCGAAERRRRALPSRVGVYLLLAAALFEHVGLRAVFGKLTGGLSGFCFTRVSEKALRDVRRRIGARPLELLFQILAGPIAPPGTTGCFYRGLRTVAFDGCKSIQAPDAPRVLAWLSKMRTARGPEGYPRVLLMALCETGTRALIGAFFAPAGTGEIESARRLLPLLGPGMLLLDDRGFDSNEFLSAINATRAVFLVRARCLRRPPVLALAPDGSYLSRIGGLKVRIIEARVTATGQDGSVVTDTYRLMTTLLDHREHPAETLLRLYHERWEVESAFYALRYTILNGRVLRSKDEAGLRQELWAILCCYQLLRRAMLDAATAAPTRIDPDRLSFSIALEAARDSVIRAEAIAPEQPDSLGQIGRRLLADPLPERRLRFSARKVKCPVSRYAARQSGEQRPARTTRITAIDAEIQQPAPPPTAAARKTKKHQAERRVRARRARARNQRRPPAKTTDSNRPPTRPGPDRDQILALITTAPDQAHTLANLAEHLGIHTPKARNSLGVRLSQWSQQGLIRKTAPATYMINKE
jgi:hypothetical protein